jgi:hypothetical protein
MMARQEHRHWKDRLVWAAGASGEQAEHLGAGVARLGVRPWCCGAASADGGENVHETRFEYLHIRVRGFCIHRRYSNQLGVPQLSEPIITAKSVPYWVDTSKGTNPYMIVGMIMPMLTVWTLRMIMAVHMVMRVVVMMVFMMVSMPMPMSMSMAVRMTVMRMAAHCYHAKQIDD